MTQEPSTQTQPKHTAARLMKLGLVLLVIGLALCALALGSTHAELNPVTLVTEQTRGTPTPIAWLALIAGVVLTLVGYAKLPRR